MGVLGGLALVLAVANGSIWQREQLLGSGRVVILELAPVDPRSLMQGDYMALTFAAGREVTRLRKDGSRDPALTQDEVLNYEPDGYLVLAQDERGVGKVLRIQPGTQPRADGEVPLRYRVRDNSVRIVTNAYFFPRARPSAMKSRGSANCAWARTARRCWCGCWGGLAAAIKAARAHAQPPGGGKRRAHCAVARARKPAGSAAPSRVSKPSARQASCSAASGAFVSMAGAPFCLDSFRPLSASRISGTCMCAAAAGPAAVPACAGAPWN